jgi:hypothetical protein
MADLLVVQWVESMGKLMDKKMVELLVVWMEQRMVEQ